MKVKGPLMSLEARGTVGHVLTFSNRKTGQQARYQKKQADVITAPRTAQRAKFLNASLSCRFYNFGVAYFGITIFGADADFYNEKASGKKMSGYNFCISETINAL